MPATKRLAGMARSYKLFPFHQPLQGGVPFLFVLDPVL
jgi:hypothetical protein